MLTRIGDVPAAANDRMEQLPDGPNDIEAKRISERLTHAKTPFVSRAAFLQ